MTGTQRWLRTAAASTWIAISFLAVLGADAAAGGSVGPESHEARLAWVRDGLAALGLAGAPDNLAQTLATLRKVGNYPIYTMHYFGPYTRASELLATATPRALASEARTGLGCSLLAAVGDPEAPMFGRNFDWEYSPLLVLFLEPEIGYRSVVSVDLAYLVELEVVNRLDTASMEEILPLLSASFLPFDGMNEVGLAVGMASVDYECGYPVDGDKADVGDLELMRQILEAAATVEEAITFLEGVNPVSQGGPNMHYLLADRTPSAALVEYDRGEMYVFRSTPETPWQLGTNFPVVRANGRPAGRCWRYDRISQTLQDGEGDLSSLETMQLLQAVSTGMTQWSIVYDLAKASVFVAAGRDYASVVGMTLGEEEPMPQTGEEASEAHEGTPGGGP